MYSNILLTNKKPKGMKTHNYNEKLDMWIKFLNWFLEQCVANYYGDNTIAK